MLNEHMLLLLLKQQNVGGRILWKKAGFTAIHLLYEFGVNHLTILSFSVFVCQIDFICHRNVVRIKWGKKSKYSYVSSSFSQYIVLWMQKKKVSTEWKVLSSLHVQIQIERKANLLLAKSLGVGSHLFFSLRGFISSGWQHIRHVSGL